MSEATVKPEVSSSPTIKVYSRATWSGSWAHAPYVVVESVVNAAGPTISQAKLRYDYGNIKREDTASFSFENPLDMKNLFIRVDSVVDEGEESESIVVLFYGFVPSETLHMHSSRSGVESGRYDFTALGLEYLLDNFRLHESDTDDGSGTTIRVNHAIPFNMQLERGLSLFGNRSSAKPAGSNSYVFSGDNEEWSNLDIAEHLLERTSTNGIDWALTGQTELLANLKPRMLDLGGMTIRECMNTLIDRRRCAGWRVKVDAGGNTVSVDVFSVLGQGITEGGVSIPANQDVLAIALDGNQEVKGAHLTVETATRYDKIRVRGARMKSVLTVGVGRNSLEPAWTTQEQSAYNAADDEARTNDDYRHVWTTLVVPENYDYDGAHPSVGLDGSLQPLTPAPLRRWDRTFLRQLPINKAWDGLRSEFQEPFAVVRNPLAPAEDNSYILVDRLDAIDLQGVSLRMLDSDPGIEFGVPANHLTALNHFTGVSNVLPEFDYETALVTVALETDHHPEYVVDIDSSSSERILTIDVPDAELWWIAPDTVTGLEGSGALRLQATGEAVRDDTPRLREIGALAKAWYGTKRAALNTTITGVIINFPVGTYITETPVGQFSEAINSVITAVTYDLVNFTTTLQTGYQELDFGSIAS